MTITLNKAAERHATLLIKGGHYDPSSSWDASAVKAPTDGDWDTYAAMFLGIDGDAEDETEGRYKYPFGMNGKVYKRALDAIDSRATQNGDTAIDQAARRLKDLIVAEEDKKAKEDGRGTDDSLDQDDPADPDGAEDDGEDDGMRGTIDIAALSKRVADEVLSRQRPQLSYRGAADLVPSTINDADRTVDMVCSTGASVRRYDWGTGKDYDEVLAIKPGAIRLDRMNAGAPFLDSHDYWSGTAAMRGAVVPGTARIENGQLLARVKFSSSPEGQQAFQDVKDGILRHVSVGYQTHKFEVDDTTSPETRTATDWEPYEVSAVAMPADPGAGFRSVARTLTTREQGSTMTTTAAAPDANAPDAATIRAQAATAERARITEIASLGKRLNLGADFIETHQTQGTGLEDFRRLALEQLAGGDSTRAIDPKAPPVGSPAVIGRHRTVEMKKGQMGARLVRLVAAAKGDVAGAIRLAKTTAWDDGHTDVIVRALEAGVGASGGFLIPEDYSAEWIELLRPRTIIRKAGARTIPLPRGNMTINRLQAGASATYNGESIPMLASQEEVGQVILREKKLGAIVPISNDLLKFASIQADEFVMEDMIAQIAVAEDAAFIRGGGTQYTPKGLRNFALSGSILTSSGSTSQQITADVVDMLSALELANVRMINPAWIMSPRSKNFLKGVQSTTGNYIFRDEMNAGTFWGYPFYYTTSNPTNLGTGTQTEILLVDLADFIIGEDAGIEIDMFREGAYVDSTGTMQSTVNRDETVIRALERHDCSMRHDASVAVLTGVNY